MTNSIQDLMNMGLSEAEAKRVINRNAKEMAAKEATLARANKRLPKLEAELAHATNRAEHWAGIKDELEAKVAEVSAVIDGRPLAAPVAEGEEPTEEPTEEPVKKGRTSRKK